MATALQPFTSSTPVDCGHTNLPPPLLGNILQLAFPHLFNKLLLKY